MRTRARHAVAWTTRNRRSGSRPRQDQLRGCTAKVTANNNNITQINRVIIRSGNGSGAAERIAEKIEKIAQTQDNDAPIDEVSVAASACDMAAPFAK
jgi:hypothetical protein